MGGNWYFLNRTERVKESPRASLRQLVASSLGHMPSPPCVHTLDRCSVTTDKNHFDSKRRFGLSVQTVGDGDKQTITLVMWSLSEDEALPVMFKLSFKLTQDSQTHHRNTYP